MKDAMIIVTEPKENTASIGDCFSVAVNPSQIFGQKDI